MSVTLAFGGGVRKRGRPKKEKLPFGITPEFKSEVESGSTEDLKARIVSMQKDLDDVNTFLKTNEKLEQLRSELKELEGPSRETKKSLNNRTKMILKILTERGAL
jgi:cob(I)alamin adenosyltransferase